MVNILKIIFLGLIGFSVITYFTAEKPKKLTSKNINEKILYSELSNHFKVVESKKINLLSKGELFINNKYLIVSSYDAMIVFKDIEKYLNSNDSFILVPNISDINWSMKKFFVESKLEELKNNTKLKIIYDENSSLVNTLNINNTKGKFYIYKINSDSLNLIHKGKIEENLYEKKYNNTQIVNIFDSLNIKF